MHEDVAQVASSGGDYGRFWCVSNAGVERGFSTYNLIVTVLRNRLAQATKEKLIINSSSTKSIETFEPEEVIEYWQTFSSKNKNILYEHNLPYLFNVDKNETFLKPKKKAQPDAVCKFLMVCVTLL